MSKFDHVEFLERMFSLLFHWNKEFGQICCVPFCNLKLSSLKTNEILETDLKEKYKT